MKKVLVTGGTVFVSRYVAEYYVGKGNVSLSETGFHFVFRQLVSRLNLKMFLRILSKEIISAFMIMNIALMWRSNMN